MVLFSNLSIFRESNNLFIILHICYEVFIFIRSTNLTELAKAVKMLAALAPNESDSRQLLDSARMLATATAKLLDAALPENLEVK